jgi:hypothetical protein
LSGSLFRFHCDGPALFLASWTGGVGHIRTAIPSGIPPWANRVE